MMGILRLIASAKTTVFILILLALTALFVAFGQQLAVTKTLMLDQGLTSLPFLILLDLLLLNQFAAAIVRFRQYRLRKKDPFYTHPAEEDVEELDIDDEWGVTAPKKKSGFPLPFPSPMAEQTGVIDTLLPADNAQAMLTTLSFDLQHNGEEEADGAERIVGRKGSRTTFYTFLLHIGAMGLLAGLLMVLAVMPGQRTTLLNKAKAQTLQPLKQTPYKSFLGKIGLGSLVKQQDGKAPLVASLDAATPRSFRTYQLIRVNSNKLKHWEDSFTRLFIKPDKLSFFRLGIALPSAYEFELTLSRGKKAGHKVQLTTGESRIVEGYRITASRPLHQLTVQDGDKTHTLSTDKPNKAFAAMGLRFHGIFKIQKPIAKTKAAPAAKKADDNKEATKKPAPNKADAKDTPKQGDAKKAAKPAQAQAPKIKQESCILLSYMSASKQPRSAPPKANKGKAAKQPQKTSGSSRKFVCTALGKDVNIGDKSLAIKAVQTGLTLRYQRAEAMWVLWVGLLLFLLGFIGFWWPTRYELLLLWRRGKNDIVIRGTGLGIRPKEMLDGIANTLYFPTEWLGGPSRRQAKAAPPAPSAPPAPPRPQQLQPTPSASAQAAPRPTETRERPPLPATPPPPAPQQPPAARQAASTAKQPVPSQQAAPQPRQPAVQAAAKAAPPAPPVAASAPPAPPAPARQPQRQAAPNASILPPTGPTQPKAAPQQPKPAPVKSKAPAPPASRHIEAATPQAPQRQAPPAPPVPPQKKTQTSDRLPALGQAPQPVSQTKQSADTTSRVAVQPKSSLLKTDSFDQTEVNRALASSEAPTTKSPPPAPPRAKISQQSHTPRETTGHPTIQTVQPETLLPKKEASKPKKDTGLDLDSLFSGLDSNKPTSQDTAPGDIALDIDSLFNDFEDKMTNTKKKS